jgi:hypothetical protein
MLVYSSSAHISRFRSNGQIEPRDVIAASDRQQFGSTGRPSYSVVFAGGAEDLPDAARLVAEVIARVVGTVDTVQDAAAVGVDQAAEKSVWVHSRDLALPRQQLDRALVFLSRPVLWEYARPVFPGGVDHDTTFGRALRYFASADELHRTSTLGDDVRVFFVEADSQAIDVASMPRQTTVTEVQAKQVDVCRFVELGALTAWAATASSRPERSLMPPVEHCSAIDARRARDRAVVHAGGDQPVNLVPLRLRAHLPRLPEPAARAGQRGDRIAKT